MRSVLLTLLAMMVCMVLGCSSSGGDGSDGNGDEVNWDLPDLPSLAEEQTAITPTITGMKNALAVSDAAAAAQWMVPESRDSYEAIFTETPELMSLLAGALESAQLKMVAEDDRTYDNTLRRLGNVEVEYDGIVFYVTVVKVDGTWLFVKL